MFYNIMVYNTLCILFYIRSTSDAVIVCRKCLPFFSNIRTILVERGTCFEKIVSSLTNPVLTSLLKPPSITVTRMSVGKSLL